MRRLIYLAWQNLKRKPFRTFVMLMSIICATASVYLALIFSRGIEETITISRERLGADLVVVPKDSEAEAQAALIAGSPTSFYMPAMVEQEIAKINGVAQTSPQVFLRSLDAPCCISQVALVGFDPEKDITITPWTLQKMGQPLPEDQIIVGAKVISAVVGTPVKAIGQRLIFMGKPFTVASILEPTGLGTDFTVFVNMDAAYKMMADSPLYPVPVKRDQISAVLVKVAKDSDPAQVAADIEKALPTLTAITSQRLTREVGGELKNLAYLLYGSAFLFSILAIALCAMLFHLSIKQRTREMGFFRAMGATGNFISGLIITEAFGLGGVGAALGLCIGAVALYLLKESIVESIGNLYMWPGTPYLWAMALACFLVTLCAALAGGFLAGRRIRTLDPYGAIRQGE